MQFQIQGGLVVENSIVMKKGTLDIEFDVTDLENTIHVKYELKRKKTKRYP